MRMLLWLIQVVIGVVTAELACESETFLYWTDIFALQSSALSLPERMLVTVYCMLFVSRSCGFEEPFLEV